MTESTKESIKRLSYFVTNAKTQAPLSAGISFLYSKGEGGDLSFDVGDVEIDISNIHGIYHMGSNEEGGRYLDGIWLDTGQKKATFTSTCETLVSW